MDIGVLKALGDENRLAILELLSRRDYCVRGLSRQLDLTQAAVSQHLKVLREAGLLRGERRGYFIHYRLCPQGLLALSGQLSALAEATSLPCSPRRTDCAGRAAADCPAWGGRYGNEKEEAFMKIAVTYENGQVFQHFGHCAQFKLYQVENGAVTESRVVDAAGSGHGALAGFLQGHGVDTLICGGIGGGARMALAEAGIRLYPGVTGEADERVAQLLSGGLEYDPDTVCSHHHEGHNCGSHSCGEDKHGCAGN